MVKEYPQPITAAQSGSCFACEKICSTQDAHIFSRLYLQRRGIPERLCDASWNLISLCFECHQVYDLLDAEGRHNRGRRNPTEADLEKRDLIKKRLEVRFSEADKWVKELLADVHPLDIAKGDMIAGAEITGFDITGISSGIIRVFTYKEVKS